MTDDLVCPICKTKAKPIDNTEGTIGFDCPKHRRFRVTRSVFAAPAHRDASEKRWEKALQRARERDPDAWAPTIKSDDFDDYG